MGHHREAFVGIDTSKLQNDVTVAEAGRNGEVRYLGAYATDEATTRKLIARLAGQYDKLTFFYEAGPTGYGLHRLITRLGHESHVVAPSLVPKKAGSRIKNNRRDSDRLARSGRADELTAIWVPDEGHEAMRDLSRAREAAVDDLKRKRQQVLSLLLRHGLFYPAGRKTWGKTHRRWLAGIKLANRGTRIAFEELMGAEREAQARVDRLTATIAEAVPEWSLAPYVRAVMALRGVDLVAAVVVMAELGDLTRFAGAPQLMSFLGQVPSEDSTGDTIKRGPITKTGNARVRKILTESAWTYRHPPRVGPSMQARVEAAPPIAREIAWKAQTRLSARYRKLCARGKRPTVVATAIARELSGFIWDICRQVSQQGVGRDERRPRDGRPQACTPAGSVDRPG